MPLSGWLRKMGHKSRFLRRGIITFTLSLSVVFLNWEKKNRFLGGKPRILKGRVCVGAWAIILSQQMNNQAVRVPNISLERRLEKPEWG